MSESSSSNIQTLNSRFKLLDRPVAIPGRCVVCGAVDRPVVDTGWSIDYYGVVYFCVLCLAEVSGVIGMVDGKLLQAAEMDSARQFEVYIQKHELKVITNEQHLFWLTTVSRLYDDITNDSIISNVQDNIETTPTEPTADEDVIGTVEQEFNFALDEGSSSVSASSSNGDKLFELGD